MSGKVGVKAGRGIEQRLSWAGKSVELRTWWAGRGVGSTIPCVGREEGRGLEGGGGLE